MTSADKVFGDQILETRPENWLIGEIKTGKREACLFLYEPRRTRTYNQLIKSQLLCQLS